MEFRFDSFVFKTRKIFQGSSQLEINDPVGWCIGWTFIFSFWDCQIFCFKK